MEIICKCGNLEEVPEDVSLEHMTCMECGRTGDWLKMEINEENPL